jgi:tyrosinase
MKVSFGILASVLGASSLVASVPTDQSSASDLILSLNEKATSALEEAETQPTKRSGPKKCTIFNAAVRRDW